MDSRAYELSLISRELNEFEFLAFSELILVLRQTYNVPEVDYSACQIFRFFKSLGLNSSKTLEVILKNIEWRKTAPLQKAAELDIQRFDFVFQNIKMGFFGVDFGGRPIEIIQPSAVDPQAFVDRFSVEERFIFFLQRLERLCNIVLPLCCRQAGRFIDGLVSIIDMKHVKITKIMANVGFLNALKVCIKTFEEQYPDLTHRVMIINTGFFFNGLWSVIKLFLSQQTQTRVTILGSNYMPELLKFTTIERLPKEIGGTSPYKINAFPNLFDAEMKSSFKEKRLTFKTANISNSFFGNPLNLTQSFLKV